MAEITATELRIVDDLLAPLGIYLPDSSGLGFLGFQVQRKVLLGALGRQLVGCKLGLGPVEQPFVSLETVREA
jgi:hypothetical protein